MQQLAPNGLPPQVNRFIQERKQYRGKDLTILSFPIWSVTRFAAILAAGPPVVATIGTAARTAFSYGLNQDMAPAGRAGVTATQADTNLQNAGQTRDQSDVFIYGISAYVTQDSEPAFVPELIRETDVQISTNGSITLPLGTIEMFPSPGGLFGGGNSNMVSPSFADEGKSSGGPGGAVSFFSNGNPTSGSFYKLDAPIFWAGIGSGPDSSLSLICTPRRAIVKTSSLARVAGVAGATYGGEPGVFNPIVAAEAFVDIRWRLHAASVQVRSSNA